MARKCFLSLFTLTLLLLSSSALGQDGDYPKVEVFGGFSFGQIEVQEPVVNTFDHEPTIGFQAAVTVNVNRTLGFVTDFGGLWGDLPFTNFSGGSSGGGTFRMLHIFAGPRFTKRMEGVTVFAHALPGFAWQLRTERFKRFFFGPTTTTSTSNGFAVALGAGVDVNLGKHLASRAVQVDYLPARVFSSFRNNVRVGVGVVWQFGGL
jgi:hypothetical protein